MATTGKFMNTTQLNVMMHRPVPTYVEMLPNTIPYSSWLHRDSIDSIISAAALIVCALVSATGAFCACTLQRASIFFVRRASHGSCVLDFFSARARAAEPPRSGGCKGGSDGGP